jgi:hypothetical protein
VAEGGWLRAQRPPQPQVNVENELRAQVQASVEHHVAVSYEAMDGIAGFVRSLEDLIQFVLDELQGRRWATNLSGRRRCSFRSGTSLYVGVFDDE